jgi:acyl-CoA thioesterase-1
VVGRNIGNHRAIDRHRLATRLLIAVLLPVACTGEEGAVERVVYVAVGASDTTGVGLADPAREAWPQVFRRAALPDDARFVNVGVSGSTVADALRVQVPRALDADPTLVTVWLNVNDLVRLVGPDTYEARLRDLVNRLRGGGRTTVLVANTPRLDHLPVVSRFGIDPALVSRGVDSYNAAIQRVVESEGAVLVDLHAEEVDPVYVGPDGFHPSASGHRAVAALFAAAYERSRATASRTR